MNRQFIFINNHVIISDENGELSGPIKYTSNIKELLRTENDIEYTISELRKTNEEIINTRKTKKDKYKEIILDTGATIITGGIISYLQSQDLQSFIDKLGISITLTAVAATTLIFYPIHQLSKTIENKKIKELKNKKELLEIKLEKEREKYQELQQNKTEENKYYNDYDIVNVDYILKKG